MTHSLVERFVVWAEKCPTATAVVDGDQRYSYRELDQHSNQLAVSLQRAGVVPASQVGIHLKRGYSLVVAVLGALKADCCYLPLDPSYPPERLQYMLTQAAASGVISSHDTSAITLPEGCSNLQIPPFNKSEDTAPPVTRQAATDPPTYCLYTSGSTGLPKGVLMGNQPLEHLIRWQIEHSAVAEGGRTLQFSPLNFDVSFQEIFATLCAGGTLVLIKDQHRLDAVALLSFIIDNHINRLFMPFVALQGLAEAAAQSGSWPDCVKEIYTAGEALKIDQHLRALFQALPNCRLQNQYGPTETHVVTAATLSGPAQDWPELPPIGQPLPHVSLRIIDDQDQPVAEGQTGQLLIGGQALARGYVNQPELTAERFVEIDGERYYRSGDLVRMGTEQEGLHFVGRIDGQLKIRGFRVEPGEIEIALARHPEVSVALVEPFNSRHGDLKLAAYFTGQAVPVNRLREFLADHLPDYMIPGHYVHLESFPRTASGKIDRLQLSPNSGSRPPLTAPYLEPQTALEQQYVAIWEHLLEVSPVGLNDNFFDLGGDSLLTARFIDQLKCKTGIDISPLALFENPTISGLIDADNTDQQRAAELSSAAAATPLAGEQRDIAIIGMALRFPGANSPQEFWQNLLDGVESIRFFDPALLPAQQRGEDYIAAKAVIDDPARFDAAFFGITPREAEVMDPQQRVFLELACNALEDAGYPASDSPSNTGVFAGTANNSYWNNNLSARPDVIAKIGDFTAMVGNEKDYVATRVAHKLNLTGPAISVHTACSTSLVAIHQAVAALRAGDCQMALAGAASISAPQVSAYRYQEGGMLSKDGHCRPFDAQASGTIFSDGAAAIVLKPLAQAQCDGDQIYALIKGSAINNDGADKASFSAPNPHGQARVIVAAQKNAGISADQVGFVEAHGTATPLGDPIEIQALGNAFAANGGAGKTCLVGSVKSNFGHLTAAAGIAGLIKAALIARHGVIPATLHYRQGNPAAGFEQSPFRVNSAPETWPEDRPRITAVSSFGVGGTNAHVILAEPPAQQPSGEARPWQLLISSNATAEGLQAQEQALSELPALANGQANYLADLAFSLSSRRRLHSQASFVVASTGSQAIAAWSERQSPNYRSRQVSDQPHRVVFLFPGQGAQTVGMGQTLYRCEPLFRATVDYCAQLLLPLLQSDLRHLLYPQLFDRKPDPAQLAQTLYTQLSLFVTQYALAKLWMSWGVQPSAMFGHSIGEWTAACLAECVSLPDALTAVYHRGRLMQAQPAGAMLSLRADEDRLKSMLGDSLDLAAINGPNATVASGPVKAIAHLQLACEQAGLAARTLNTSHAFHSRSMAAAAVEFEKQMQQVEFRPPVIPFISCVSGEFISDQMATSPAYWSSQIRRPVQCAKGLQTVASMGPIMGLELGPGSTLTSLFRQNSSGHPQASACKTLTANGDDDENWQALLFAIAELTAHRCPFNHRGFFAGQQRRAMTLPAYVFGGQRHWIEATVSTGLAAVTSPSEKLNADAAIPMNVSVHTTLLAEIKTLIEQSSGFDLADAPATTSFLELGLDSLLLTQIATSVKGQFDIQVSFRQLMEELTSLDLLANHLERAMSPDQLAQWVSDSPADSPGVNQIPMPSAAPGSGSPAYVQQVIDTQLALMAQQLELLRGDGPGNGSAAGASAAAMIGHPANPASRSEQPPAPAENPAATFGPQTRIETKGAAEVSSQVASNLQAFAQSYLAKSPRSREYAQKHRPTLADPRVVSGFKPLLKEMVYPLVVKHSSGSKLTDIDDNLYVDLVNGFGTNFLGHGPDYIKAALHEQIEKGFEIGPQSPLAGEVAQLLCEISGMERAALCNTGSEAVAGALRLARTVTGRSTIVMFEGAYHGINDEVIVRGTRSGRSVPAAAGIPAQSVANVVVLEYGSDEALSFIEENSRKIAAVLVEPVQSRNPALQPAEFLQRVRELTAQSGTALIFDEVITGFRICPGGAQEHFGIRADIATYGKIIGGGMPIGAIVGCCRFLDALDGGQWQFGDNSIPEVGVTYFAGTFVRHPLTLASAKAALGYIKSQGPALQQSVNDKAQALFRNVNAHYEQIGFPFRLKSFGSMFKVSFTEDALSGLFFYKMRELGIHVWEGRPCFITVAHSQQDMELLENCFKACAQFMIDNQFAETGGDSSPMVTPGTTLSPPVPGARLGRDPEGNPAWFSAAPTEAAKPQ